MQQAIKGSTQFSELIENYRRIRKPVRVLGVSGSPFPIYLKNFEVIH